MTVIAGSLITFHRGCLQSGLLSQILSSATIHTSKRLSHIREPPNGQKELVFTDFGTARADFVIGADGLQSATRRCLIEKVKCSHSLLSILSQKSHNCLLIVVIQMIQFGRVRQLTVPSYPGKGSLMPGLPVTPIYVAASRFGIRFAPH
jgi:hypothetical protein